MSRKLLLIGALLTILLLAVFSTAYASSYNGTLTITCTHAYNFGPGLITLDRDNTGSGLENFEIIATDGAGNVLRDFFNTLSLGDYVFGDLIFTTAPTADPITVKFISLAGNGLLEQTVFSIQGSCGGSCLPLTANAVVGDMPAATQADYAPGQVASGVVINPGTYWVLGEDASGKYYKILLACQYLWVPVESMQPSFQAPWQGQPLPTDNVE